MPEKFALTFDSVPSREHPNGYWYAKSINGDCEGVGATVETALADLVLSMDKQIKELEDILSGH